jgi:hypothetical protein
MTIRRTLSIGTVTLFLAAVLTACFPQLPGINTGGNTGGDNGGDTTVELTGTWTGTDSDGDDWEIEFQADNTLGISFNGDGPSDEPGDTWRLSGNSLEMTVTGFEDGDIEFTGTYDGGSAIPLTGTYAGRPFTLTLND